jgi:iron(III) transport system ATP-binding protein
MYESPETLFAAEFMGSNNRLPGAVLQRDGDKVVLDVAGSTLHGTARGNGELVAPLIRVEEVRISSGAVQNALELPLVTCMYLGDRWECLFKRGDISLRAHSKQRLQDGHYWLQLPADKLWVF